MEVIILLLIVVGIFYIPYLIWKFQSSYRQTKEALTRKQQARQIDAGAKPYGSPMGKTYGSAYFMTTKQVLDAGIAISADELLERRRTGDLGFLMLGSTTIPRGTQPAVNVLSGPGHVLTIAPTRSGKGTCAVIPNLLNYDGSVIVNDIKGENHAVTAIWREAIGQSVYKFAPFDEEGSDRWNPFDMLSDGEEAWEDAMYMAELLIAEGKGDDAFWRNGARNLLTGLILYVHQSGEDGQKNLEHVRELLSQDEVDLANTLATMASSGSKAVQRAANVFLRADDKVRSGILSTLDSDLGFLDSERLAKCMRDSTFSFKELKESKTSIFFVVPPERLRTYAPVVRLFMGMATLEMKRTRTKPEYPVLFMLDEFPALGHMKVIQDEISYLAGYDIHLWLFAQDLKQIGAIYGEGLQSIFANCVIKQFFGVADYETAKIVSLMCGETTSPTITYSTNGGLDVLSDSTSSSGRPLLTENEIMNLNPAGQLLFYQGQQPIDGEKINYLKTDILFVHEGQKLYSPNPFHE